MTFFILLGILFFLRDTISTSAKKTDKQLTERKIMMKKCFIIIAVVAAVFICCISCTKSENTEKTTAHDNVLTSIKDEAESAGERISEKLSEGASKAKDAVEDGATKISEKLTD